MVYPHPTADIQYQEVIELGQILYLKFLCFPRPTFGYKHLQLMHIWREDLLYLKCKDLGYWENRKKCQLLWPDHSSNLTLFSLS